MILYGNFICLPDQVLPQLQYVIKTFKLEMEKRIVKQYLFTNSKCFFINRNIKQIIPISLIHVYFKIDIADRGIFLYLFLSWYHMMTSQPSKMSGRRKESVYHDSGTSDI